MSGLIVCFLYQHKASVIAKLWLEPTLNQRGSSVMHTGRLLLMWQVSISWDQTLSKSPFLDPRKTIKDKRHLTWYWNSNTLLQSIQCPLTTFVNFLPLKKSNTFDLWLCSVVIYGLTGLAPKPLHASSLSILSPCMPAAWASFALHLLSCKLGWLFSQIVSIFVELYYCDKPHAEQRYWQKGDCQHRAR